MPRGLWKWQEIEIGKLVLIPMRAHRASQNHLVVVKHSQRTSKNLSPKVAQL